MTTINERLENLPRKVAFPLINLVRVGQLDEPQLEAILDAGELAGNNQHLLGFATGAMAMEAKRIPICDTVRMAKQLGRTVRLDWSPRRWRETHERLQNLITLQEINEENCTYDVSYFRCRLPEKFSGYLITTRRRLALVGFIQKHCVASYHSQILDERCAIVCVFIDRVRWTVQLRKTRQGMHIAQIRTMCNKEPTRDIEFRIHEVLKMPGGMIDEPHAPDVSELVSQANMVRAVETLADQGVQSVALTYQDSAEPQLPGIDAIRFSPVRPDRLEIEGYCSAAAMRNCLEPAFHDIVSMLEDRLAALVSRYITCRTYYGGFRTGWQTLGELKLDPQSRFLEFSWSMRTGTRHKIRHDSISWDLSTYEPQVVL